MFNISKNQAISLTRGDTAAINIVMRDDADTVVSPEEGDKFFFRVKSTPSDNVMIIEKEFDATTGSVAIAPEDTIEMQFGSFCYEIEYVTSDGGHFTIVANKPFNITPELENH